MVFHNIECLPDGQLLIAAVNAALNLMTCPYLTSFLPFLPSESRPERAGVHELRQDHPRAGRPRRVLRRQGRRAQLVPQDLRVHRAARLIVRLGFIRAANPGLVLA